MSRPPVWPVHGAGRGTGGIDRVDRGQGARRPFELHLRAGLGGLGLVVLLAGCPAWTCAGALAESWAGLMTYPREAPAPREEASLLSAWGEMLANYPAAAMRSGARTLEALEGIPAAYRRQHRHYDSGPKEWARRLAPYRHWVDTAARRFDVPPSLIEGVILQESGGDAAARATGSSAKGLMQTIDATFALAKKTLAGEGLRIEDPLTPRDSILAGAWYLAYCFDLAVREHGADAAREAPRAWRRALEYYYAGPGWGRDPRAIIHIYRNGKRTRVHKGRYSDGVLAYVRALDADTPPAGS